MTVSGSQQQHARWRGRWRGRRARARRRRPARPGGRRPPPRRMHGAVLTVGPARRAGVTPPAGRLVRRVACRRVRPVLERCTRARGVQADGGGRRQVEALGPAVQRHGDRGVGEREQPPGRARAPRCRTATRSDRASSPAASAASRSRAAAPSAASTCSPAAAHRGDGGSRVGLDGHRQVEQRADARAHGLGVVRVDTGRRRTRRRRRRRRRRSGSGCRRCPGRGRRRRRRPAGRVAAAGRASASAQRRRKRQTATSALRVDGVVQIASTTSSPVSVPRDAGRVGGVAQRGVPAGGGRGGVDLDDGAGRRPAPRARPAGPRRGSGAPSARSLRVDAQTTSRPDPPGAGGQRRLRAARCGAGLLRRRFVLVGAGRGRR